MHMERQPFNCELHPRARDCLFLCQQWKQKDRLVYYQKKLFKILSAVEIFVFVTSYICKFLPLHMMHNVTISYCSASELPFFLASL